MSRLTKVSEKGNTGRKRVLRGVTIDCVSCGKHTRSSYGDYCTKCVTKRYTSAFSVRLLLSSSRATNELLKKVLEI